MRPATTWRRQGEEIKEPLHYPACGLDDVYLLNGYEWHNTPYGKGVSVKNLDELRKAIGLHLAMHKKALSGKEVRFLRKQMDLSQSGLSRLFGVDSQTIARWEKGQARVPGTAEGLLRVVYLEHTLGCVKVHELLSELDETDATISGRQVFERTEDGWRPAA